MIRSLDLDMFHGPKAEGALPNGMITEEEFIAIRPSEKNNSTETASNGFMFSLSSCGIEMIPFGDDVLIPLNAIQSGNEAAIDTDGEMTLAEFLAGAAGQLNTEALLDEALNDSIFVLDEPDTALEEAVEETVPEP